MQLSKWDGVKETLGRVLLLYPICCELQSIYRSPSATHTIINCLAASPSQREMQAFSKGEEFGALMILQGGSGTKLSDACSSRFEGDVATDDFLAATQGPFRRQHKRFLCLMTERLLCSFFFFFFAFAP